MRRNCWLLALLLLLFTAQSVDAQEARLRVTYGFSTSSLADRLTRMWGEAVGKSSKLTLEIYPFGQLFPDAATLQAVEVGRAEIGIVSASLVPGFRYIQAPFLFASFDAASKHVNADLPRNGPRDASLVLAFWPTDTAALISSGILDQPPSTNSQLITFSQPSRFERIAISKGYARTTVQDWSAKLSTAASGSRFAEVGISALAGRNLQSSAAVTLTRHDVRGVLLVANRPAFDRLAPELRRLLTDSAKKVALEASAMAEERARATVEALRKEGISIKAPSNLNAWVAAFRPDRADRNDDCHAGEHTCKIDGVCTVCSDKCTKDDC